MPELDFDTITQRIRSCLCKLYDKDAILFTRNNKHGLCERCLVFRFALYLHENFSNGYFVDCDFNNSLEYVTDANGIRITKPDVHGKGIPNIDGTTTKRFVDIIIHKRNLDAIDVANNDFICFEVKKWNCKKLDIEKDLVNLRVLTSPSGYAYRHGFLLILGQTKNKTEWIIFHGGQQQQREYVFPS
jgi:hypothetical protein